MGKKKRSCSGLTRTSTPQSSSCTARGSPRCPRASHSARPFASPVEPHPPQDSKLPVLPPCASARSATAETLLMMKRSSRLMFLGGRRASKLRGVILDSLNANATSHLSDNAPALRFYTFGILTRRSECCLYRPRESVVALQTALYDCPHRRRFPNPMLILIELRAIEHPIPQAVDVTLRYHREIT